MLDTDAMDHFQFRTVLFSLHLITCCLFDYNIKCHHHSYSTIASCKRMRVSTWTIKHFSRAHLSKKRIGFCFIIILNCSFQRISWNVSFVYFLSLFTIYIKFIICICCVSAFFDWAIYVQIFCSPWYGVVTGLCKSNTK